MASGAEVRQGGRMRSFPLPIRVAAGLAATAAEQARHAPSYLLGLPVTVASQALQMSMRVQQHVTELAIKGDEALAGWHTVEEQPDWAVFDEDEAADAPTRTVPADYERLTLPQLRGRLRGFSPAELVALLEHERTHARRPEYLRMLSNRLEKLRAEEAAGR
jgi:hypothetical protein